MTLDYEALLNTEQDDLPLSYTEKDAALYALSIGLGRDARNLRELDYVYEGSGWLKTLPTFATIVFAYFFRIQVADIGFAVFNQFNSKVV